MKYVFTLLFFSLLSAGCSSSNDNAPALDDDETSDPVPNPGGGDETPDTQDDPPAESVLDKINVDNYADLLSLVEEVGFHTLTRDYNLGALTDPFTSFTNVLFEDPNAYALDVDDTQNCDIAGTTATSGNISGPKDFAIQYDFDECQTAAGSVNGTAFYDVFLSGDRNVKHEFDVEFSNVDIQSERGDLVIKGLFNFTADIVMMFDLTSYVAKVPGSMSLEVSGSGEYHSILVPEVSDPTEIAATSFLKANFVFTTSSGDGSDELTINVETDLEFESTDPDKAGPPVAGSLTISADDNSQVVVSPADVLGMVNIDVTAADGAVFRDTRSWFDFAAAN